MVFSLLYLEKEQRKKMQFGPNYALNIHSDDSLIVVNIAVPRNKYFLARILNLELTTTFKIHSVV